MKRLIAWILSTACALVALLLLFVAGTTIVLNAAPIRRMVQSRVNTTISGSLRWDQLRVNPLRGALTVDGLCLTDKKGIEVLTIGRLTAEINLATLARRALSLSRIEIDHPVVVVIPDSNGVPSLVTALHPREPGVSGEPSGAPLWDVLLNRLQIRDGTASFLDHREDIEVRISGLNLEAGGRLKDTTAQVRLSIDSAGVSSPAYTNTLTTLQAFGVLRGSALDTLALEVRTRESVLLLSGRVEELFSKPYLHTVLETSLSLEETMHSLNPGAPGSGHARLRLSIVGSSDNPDVDARLSGRMIQVDGTRVDTLSTHLTLADRKLVVRDFLARQGTGRLTLTGTADLRPMFPNGLLAPSPSHDSVGYTLSCSASGLNLQAILGDRPGLRGDLQGSLDLIGRGMSLDGLAAEATIEVAVRGFALGGESGPTDVRLHSRMRAEDAVIAVHDLVVSTGLTLATASGHWRIRRGEFDVGVQAESQRLAPTLQALGIPAIDGTARFRAALGGDIRKPYAELTLHVDSARACGRAVDRLDLNATLDSTGVATLEELGLQTGGSRIRVSGNARVMEEGRAAHPDRLTFSAAIEADTLLLQDIHHDMRGRVGVTARLEGTAAQPHGVLRVTTDTVVLGPQRFDSLVADLRLNGTEILLDTLTARLAPGAVLHGRGTYRFDSHYEVHVGADSIPLSAVGLLAGCEGFDGIATLELEGTGSLDTPMIAGRVEIGQVRVKEQHVEDIVLALSLQGSRAHIEGHAIGDIEGTYDLESADFSAASSFSDVALNSWLYLLGREELGGVIDGTLQAAGNVNRPDEISGNVDLARLELRRGNVPLIVAPHGLKAGYDQGALFLPPSRLAVFDEGEIVVEGRGNLKGDYAGSINGSVPLGTITALFPQMPELGGAVVIDASLSGHSGPPALGGTLTLSQVEATIPWLDQRLHDLNGVLKLHRDSVGIVGWEGYMDEGRFSLSGAVALDNLKPAEFHLQIEANALPMQLPDMADLVLDATLRAHGTPDTSWIDGNVVLLQGLYYQDLDINPLGGVGKASRTSEPPPQTAASSPSSINLDVNLTARDVLLVENNVAALSIAPDLRIRGTLSDPGLTGRATVKDGTLFYRNRTFVVTHGLIDFLDPYRIRPRVDIAGTVTVDTWEIMLKATGTLDKLRLEFSSEPPEQDADILSLLIFGKTRGELPEGDITTALSPEEMLGRLLRTNRLSDNIKERTGLDVLNIETGGDGGILPVGIKVTVGKKLSPRFTTKVSVQSGAEQVIQRTTAEYRLFENALISGFQGSEGTFGGEVQLMLEFR